MKLLLIGGPLLLAIGLGLMAAYLSLAKFLIANSKALDRTHKRAADMPMGQERTQAQPITGTAPQKAEYKATAKVGELVFSILPWHFYAACPLLATLLSFKSD